MKKPVPREDIYDYLATKTKGSDNPDVLFLQKIPYDKNGYFKLEKDAKALDLPKLFKEIGMDIKNVEREDFLCICEAFLQRCGV